MANIIPKRRSQNSVDIEPSTLITLKNFVKAATTQTSAGIEIGIGANNLMNAITKKRCSPKNLHIINSYFKIEKNDDK